MIIQYGTARMVQQSNTNGNRGGFLMGTGGGNALAGGGVVTPFLMAASAAARQRKELQQAMKDSLNKAKAFEKEKETARKKKAQEEAAAAAATNAAKASGTADIDGMDLEEVSLDLDGALLANGGKEGEEDETGEDNLLAGVVRVLDKTTPVKKRSRNTEEE